MMRRLQLWFFDLCCGANVSWESLPKTLTISIVQINLVSTSKVVMVILPASRADGSVFLKTADYFSFKFSEQHKMNQAEVHRLVKALKFKVQPKPFKIGGHFGGTYRYKHQLSVMIPIIESSSLQQLSSVVHMLCMWHQDWPAIPAWNLQTSRHCTYCQWTDWNGQT